MQLPTADKLHRPKEDGKRIADLFQASATPAPRADHGQQVGAQQVDFAAGFMARRKAAMNLPAICGPTVSGSRPAA
jgi:hypothetical protein